MRSMNWKVQRGLHAVLMWKQISIGRTGLLRALRIVEQTASSIGRL